MTVPLPQKLMERYHMGQLGENKISRKERNVKLWTGFSWLSTGSNLIKFYFHHYFDAARSFLRSRVSLSWSINYPPFAQTEGSSPCSQEPAARSYLEPLESTPNSHTLFLKHLHLCLQNISFLQIFRWKWRMNMSSLSYVLHVSLSNFLDFITLTIFPEEY